MTTTSPPTARKPGRRRFQDGLRLLRTPLGLPLFEAFILLLVGTGVTVAFFFPLIQWLRQMAH